MRIRNVVIDCGDPKRLAEFWSQATDRPIERDDDPIYIGLRDPNDRDARLLLQRVPEPKMGKNRAHIDLYSDRPDEEADRLVSLGAKKLRAFTEDGEYCIVMTDPEGNEFCIVEVATSEL